jgi:glycosyltransferase involved in cell wall biosynthesis
VKNKKSSKSLLPKDSRKIGVMIDRLNVGGVEKIAIEQVKALRRQDQDAKLVILREKAVVADAFADLLEDVPIVYLDQRLPKFFRLSFQFPLFNFFSSFHVTYPFLLPFVVKKKEFDYLIVHGTYTALTAVSLKKTRGIGFSAFIWDPASYILERVYSTKVLTPIMATLKFMAKHLDKFLINNMDSVLVGGPAHNKFIRTMNPSKKITVIYPSVHPIKKLLKKSDYVLMATAWKRGKHPEYVLDVVEAMPEIRIKMVGKWLEKDYFDEFFASVKKRGFTKQIDIVGEVTEAQLANYYARANVVLQSNDDRGFGMPALEAAGHGTTFVIPKGQGVCKLFTDGEDGFYTKEKDTKAIVPILRRLQKNPAKAASMGAKGWEKVVENYSWANHAEALVSVVSRNTVN